MIDAKTIEELQGLLAKATPGPWRLYANKLRPQFSLRMVEVQGPLNASPPVVKWGGFDESQRSYNGHKANAALIVAMRNALPALLDLASKTLASAREGEESPAGILDVQRMLTIHQPTGWLARDIAIASARLQPQVSASGGEDAELCKRLEDRVVWSADRLDCIPDSTAIEAAARIRSLSLRVEAEKRAREEALAENARLARLVYVPGQWRCAKCKFTLIQANLNANDGTVTARDQPGDKCPNCDSSLWRVTERDAGNEMIDRAEEAFEAKRAAESRSAALARALEEADRILIRCFNRIHGLPRTSDTDLANAISNFRARIALEAPNG